MLNDTKSLYINLAVLASVLVFFAYYHFTLPKDSYKNVYNRAQSRLDSIAVEVTKSKELIQHSLKTLDAIQDSLRQVQNAQVKSLLTVATADTDLKKQLQLKEQELASLKNKYLKTSREKEKYRLLLDSLAETLSPQPR